MSADGCALRPDWRLEIDAGSSVALAALAVTCAFYQFVSNSVAFLVTSTTNCVAASIAKEVRTRSRTPCGTGQNAPVHPLHSASLSLYTVNWPGFAPPTHPPTHRPPARPPTSTQDTEATSRLVGHAVLLAAVLGAAVTAAVLLFPTELMRLYGVELSGRAATRDPPAYSLPASSLRTYPPTHRLISHNPHAHFDSALIPGSGISAHREVMAPALSYLVTRAVSIPSIMLMYVAVGASLGARNSSAPAMGVLAAAVVNVVGDAVFVLGMRTSLFGALAAIPPTTNLRCTRCTQHPAVCPASRRACAASAPLSVIEGRRHAASLRGFSAKCLMKSSRILLLFPQAPPPPPPSRAGWAPSSSWDFSRRLSPGE